MNSPPEYIKPDDPIILEQAYILSTMGYPAPLCYWARLHHDNSDLAANWLITESQEFTEKHYNTDWLNF